MNVCDSKIIALYFWLEEDVSRRDGKGMGMGTVIVIVIVTVTVTAV